MTREKVLDRIRKCLALSKSANEHEAAAALRQAQKMMDQHGVSEDDVAGVEYVSAQVVTDYEWKDSPRRDVRNFMRHLRGEKVRPGSVPHAVATVVGLIMHSCGVGAVYEKQPRGRKGETFYAVRYFGRRGRVEVAVHAHVVVARAVKRAWRRHLDEDPHVKGVAGARAGFYAGWCRSVYAKVHALVDDPNDREMIERAKRKHYSSEIPESDDNKQKVRSDTFEAGKDAGGEFDINRPVRRDQLRIGRDK